MRSEPASARVSLAKAEIDNIFCDLVESIKIIFEGVSLE